MDSPLPLHPLEQLPEARSVQRCPSQALQADETLSPRSIAAMVTAIGALLSAALVFLLLF